jgi:hypothetical protein
VFDAVLARADQLSSELKVRPWTHLSAILPSGLIGRMEVYATALRTALDGKSTVGPNALEAAAQLVLEHLTARGLRVGGVQMSLRLARWLVTRGEAEGAASFPAMAHEYLEQESFVDWARDALHGSEVSEPLASAYRELLIRIGERRERANHRFGELVRQWFEHDSAELSLVPVEEILERIVAPLVDVGPCLVLVVDGLALPVFHQLLAGLTAAGWVELASAETGRAVGLAALPSVTQVCRGALLRGSLGEGGQSEEKLGFEGHPTLRARSGGALPPVLFHKGGLRDDGGGALADEVRSEMLNPRRLIVGVVVNAVDDFLLRGDQLVPEWGVETIRPLAALLEAATVAGRTVILTADHGHVLEHGQEYRKVVGAGERNRPVSDVPMGGEVKVRGRRVVTPTHEIVVPWSETVRYGKMKNGYHGGATPQELLVPVAILTRGKVPGGWSALPPLLPSWWDLAEPRDEAAARPAGGERAIGKRSAAGQLPLFGGAKAAATSPWILKLVGSSVFKRQKELASRSAPQDAELQALLEALADRGGKMTRPALSQLLQRPASSLQGFLAAVERMLNVEGYAALEVTQDAVTLNREILDAQFELGE